MSNASSTELQQQLNALTTQINNAASANNNLQQEIKKVISAIVAESIALKRENVQLKAEKTSKS